MKKLLLSLLTLIIIMNFAYAEGRLEVVQKNIIEQDNRLIFFAKVQNTGDSAIAVSNGELTLQDKNANELFSRKYIPSMPHDIELSPGEYTFFYDIISEKINLSQVDDMIFNVVESSNPLQCEKLDTTLEINAHNKEAQNVEGVFISYTSKTDDIKASFYTYYVISDKDGKIYHIDFLNNRLILPHNGSSVRAQFYLTQEEQKYLPDKNDLNIETFVYQYINK